jgi:hypothetical protein
VTGNELRIEQSLRRLVPGTYVLYMGLPYLVVEEDSQHGERTFRLLMTNPKSDLDPDALAAAHRTWRSPHGDCCQCGKTPT